MRFDHTVFEPDHGSLLNQLEATGFVNSMSSIPSIRYQSFFSGSIRTIPNRLKRSPSNGKFLGGKTMMVPMHQSQYIDEKFENRKLLVFTDNKTDEENELDQHLGLTQDNLHNFVLGHGDQSNLYDIHHKLPEATSLDPAVNIINRYSLQRTNEPITHTLIPKMARTQSATRSIPSELESSNFEKRRKRQPRVPALASSSSSTTRIFTPAAPTTPFSVTLLSTLLASEEPFRTTTTENPKMEHTIEGALMKMRPTVPTSFLADAIRNRQISFIPRTKTWLHTKVISSHRQLLLR